MIGVGRRTAPPATAPPEVLSLFDTRGVARPIPVDSAGGARSRPRRLIGLVSSHVRTPLLRNGYALVLSSLATSALGMVFWIVAARRYDTAAVGRSSAVLAIASLVANLATWGMTNGLVRFLPVAGASRRVMLRVTYLVTVLSAVVLTTALALVGQRWVPELGNLGREPLRLVWLVVATAGWAVFVLQDAALVGLRRAPWVPIENSLFGVAKIALLVALSTAMPVYGPFVAFTAPALPIVVALNLWLFRRLRRETTEPGAPLSVAAVARFAAGEWVSWVALLVTVNTLPLLVSARLGEKDTAYYYLAWQIAYALQLIASGTGLSLLAEGAANRGVLAANSRRVLRQTSFLILPMAAVLAVAAPLVLSVFGADYAAEGTTTLRLLLLSGLPASLTSLVIASERVRRNLRLVVTVHLAQAVLVLALSAALVDRFGIVGVGAAWVVSQTALAAVLWVTHLGPLLAGDSPAGAVRELRTVLRERGVLPARAKALDRSARRSRATNRGWATFDLHGSPVQLRWCPAGDPALAATVTVLDSLRPVLSAELAGQLGLPRLLAAGRQGTLDYLLVSAPQGRPFRAQHATVSEITLIASEAVAPLHQLTARRVVVGHAELDRWVYRPVALLTGAPPAHPDHPLAELIGELVRDLEGRTVTVSWIHGDLVADNLRLALTGTQPAALSVSLAGWERAGDGALPDVDLALAQLLATAEAEHLDLLAVLDQQLTLRRPGPVARRANPDLAQRTVLLLAGIRYLAGNAALGVRQPPRLTQLLEKLIAPEGDAPPALPRGSSA